MPHFPTFSIVRHWRSTTFPRVPDPFTPQPYLSRIPSNMFCLVFFMSLFALPRTPVPTPVPFLTISPILTSGFHCGWLSAGDSLREAAVPQWSTTLPLSLHPFIPPLLHPPLSLLPPHWTQTEGSVGCGQCWERAGRDWGLSSHRRDGAGARRLIALQSATGKDVGLLLTKPTVKEEPERLTIHRGCVIKLTDVWAIISESECDRESKVERFCIWRFVITFGSQTEVSITGNVEQ